MPVDHPVRVPIASPAVWHAHGFADPSEWSIALTDEQRDELASVTREARARGRTATDLSLDDISLPTFTDLLGEVIATLQGGRGFVVLRRFPIDLLDPSEVELAYLALGLHLGTPVSQDAEGTLLGHVRDEGVERTGPEVRLYRTRHRQDFHSDGADIIGLLCLRPAKSGGESRLASSHAVYNEILARRPDLLEVLYEPMWWDRNGEESSGEEPAFPMSVVSDVDGTPRVFFIGWYIRDAQRHPQVPRLTSAQLEALDLIESISNDPSFHVEMDFQPGDVQLLNNASILHAREAYVDHEEPHARRHLLRLWLRAHAFASVDGQLRDGIPTRTS